MNKQTSRGFTLLELLVGVLIIGILAAIALPQYQKAVLKSRIVEAMTGLDAIMQAQEVYYLEHGTYTTRIQDLDVQIPPAQLASGWAGTKGTSPNTYMYSCHLTDGCIANAANNSLPMFEYTGNSMSSGFNKRTGKPYQKLCSLHWRKNATAERICQSFSSNFFLWGTVKYYYMTD